MVLFGLTYPGPCSSEPLLFLWLLPGFASPPSAGAAFRPKGSDCRKTAAQDAETDCKHLKGKWWTAAGQTHYDVMLTQHGHLPQALIGESVEVIRPVLPPGPALRPSGLDKFI